MAIVDITGYLLVFKRQDGASSVSSKIAIGKASTALLWKKSTRDVEALAKSRPEFFLSVVNCVQSSMISAAGGLPIKNKLGDIIGAIGISGESSDNDECCARNILDALGFSTD